MSGKGTLELSYIPDITSQIPTIDISTVTSADDRPITNDDVVSIVEDTTETLSCSHTPEGDYLSFCEQF